VKKEKRKTKTKTKEKFFSPSCSYIKSSPPTTQGQTTKLTPPSSPSSPKKQSFIFDF
jgi:hypothetical protein